MFSVESDHQHRLIKISWAKDVNAQEMRLCEEQIRILSDALGPGYRVLVDLTGLDSMETSGAKYIASIMDLFASKQVEHIVRVIPDPRKDIGLNILSYFHYGPRAQVATYETRDEALRSLENG